MKHSAPAFPLFPILGIVFVVLKITGHLSWPWLFVLAPFWAPLALALSVLLVVALVVGIAKAATR